MRLRIDIAFDQVSRGGIHRNLTGAKKKITTTHRLAVRSSRGGRAGGLQTSFRSHSLFNLSESALFASREILVFRAGFVGKFLFEFDKSTVQIGIARGENLHCKQASIARIANRDRRDGNPCGHLHD